MCGGDYDLVVNIKPCVSLICDAVYWDVTEWDFCNVPCGVGKVSREITCKSPSKIEPDSACYHLPTPPTEKICNTHVKFYNFRFKFKILYHT